MSSEIKEVIDVLDRNKKNMEKTDKFKAVMPRLEKIQREIGIVLKTVKKIENPEYSEWVVHPNSLIKYGTKTYERAKDIANAFPKGELFVFNDFIERATTADDKKKLNSYYDCTAHCNTLHGVLYRLHVNGFLDRRKIPTEKRDRTEYRINKRGLDMLQVQAMKELGMRIV